MKASRSFLILAVLIGALALPFTTSSAMASPALGCTDFVDFLAFPDNQPFPGRFMLSGFRFRTIAPPAPFVNVFNDINGDLVHGLQFSNAGIWVILPTATSIVDVEIGVFNDPTVTLRAYDAAGVLQDTETAPNDADMHTETLDAGLDTISRLRISGGGDEGVINSICTS